MGVLQAADSGGLLVNILTSCHRVFNQVVLITGLDASETVANARIS